MLLKTKINLFGRDVNFLFRVVKEKQNLMYGFGNRCKDGKYVIFLDYDETPVDWVEEEIKLLQSRYSLADAYLFRTKRGIHVVFLDKVTMGVLVMILDTTSCDKHYKEIPLYYGRKVWVLRQSPKKDEQITYIGKIKSDAQPVEYRSPLSRAHMIYMTESYKIPRHEFPPDEEFDDSDQLTIGYYKISEENG